MVSWGVKVEVSLGSVMLPTTRRPLGRLFLRKKLSHWPANPLGNHGDTAMEDISLELSHR